MTVTAIDCGNILPVEMVLLLVREHLLTNDKVCSPKLSLSNSHLHSYSQQLTGQGSFADSLSMYVVHFQFVSILLWQAKDFREV